MSFCDVHKVASANGNTKSFVLLKLAIHRFAICPRQLLIQSNSSKKKNRMAGSDLGPKWKGWKFLQPPNCQPILKHLLGFLGRTGAIPEGTGQSPSQFQISVRYGQEALGLVNGLDGIRFSKAIERKKHSDPRNRFGRGSQRLSSGLFKKSHHPPAILQQKALTRPSPASPLPPPCLTCHAMLNDGEGRRPLRVRGGYYSGRVGGVDVRRVGGGAAKPPRCAAHNVGSGWLAARPPPPRLKWGWRLGA